MKTTIRLLLIVFCLLALTAGGRPSLCNNLELSLSVLPDPNTPASRQIAMDDEWLTFSFLLKNEGFEPISVVEMPVAMESQIFAGHEYSYRESVTNMKLFDTNGRQVGPTVLYFNQDDQVFFPLTDEDLKLAGGESKAVSFGIKVNEFGRAVSGATFRFLVNASPTVVDSAGKPVPVAFPSEMAVVGNWMAIYRAVPLFTTQTLPQLPASSNQTVFEFTVNVNSNDFPDVSLHPLSFEVSGENHIDGMEDAYLYNVDDLQTPLARRQAKRIVFADLDDLDRGNEVNFEVQSSPADCVGIPIGGGVEVFRGDTLLGIWSVVRTTKYVNYPFQDCSIGLSMKPDLLVDFDDGDVLLYRPLASSGFLSFGGISNCSNLDFIDSGSTWFSTGGSYGFAVGDIVYPRGYSLEGQWVERVSGCEVVEASYYGISVTPCFLTANLSIYPGYDSISSHYHTAPSAIVSTFPGYLTDIYGNATFRVVADTTGAVTNDTLLLILNNNGLNWTDGKTLLAPGFSDVYTEGLPLTGTIFLY
jgi:hypothetical protein